MKLYYAFSNNIMFNQAIIQSNLSEEKGDLLIWSMPPIDIDLASAIKKKGIFENVWYLERPKVVEERKLKKLRTNKIKRDFYNQVFENKIGIQQYTELVIAGFWNDTLFLVDFLKRRNPNLKISICEEGLLNYYCGAHHENLYYMVQYNSRQHLQARLLGGRYFRWAQKRIYTNYLIAPDFLRSKIIAEVKKLPPINEGNPQIRNIIDEVFDQKLKMLAQEYAMRNVYYMGAMWNRQYDPVDIGPTLLSLVESIIPSDRLVIKSHTNATSHRMNYAKDVDAKIFVDREVYLFDFLCSKLDLQDKVIITRNSSIAINLTQLYEKEPIFIFTHRLHSRYHYGLDDCGDFYTEDLKRNMRDPSRVWIPDSLSEFKEMLIQISLQFCGGIKETMMEMKDEEDSSIRELLKWLEKLMEKKDESDPLF